VTKWRWNGDGAAVTVRGLERNIVVYQDPQPCGTGRAHVNAYPLLADSFAVVILGVLIARAAGRGGV
jgi:hypothetical protein